MTSRQGYGLVAVVLAIVGALGLIGAAVDRSPDDVTPTTSSVAPADVAPVLPDTPVTPAPSSTVALVVADECEVGSELREGAVSDEVACLEAALAKLGYLDDAAVDSTFDTATGDAVRQFQEAQQLRPDAVVGPVTARALGIAPEPAPPDPTTCVAEGRSVVVDRALQRAWFCEDGAVERQIPITSAWSQPDPGQYFVYAKDLNAASNLTGTYVSMTHFVAFTYGKVSGARIAFHSVPTYRNGEFAQPLSTVGALTQRGDSEGCIRVLPDDAQAIWDWLSIGDEVRVIT